MATPMVGIYCRVSSAGQVGNYRSEVQPEKVIRRVQERGWNYKLYAFEQGSGTKADERAEYQRVLADLETSRIDHIGVIKLDRALRDLDGFDAAKLKSVVRRTRALIITADKDYDLRNPSDVKSYDLEMNIAAWELSDIRQRMLEGREARSRYTNLEPDRDGKCLMQGGPPPYGYELHTVGERGGRVVRTPRKTSDDHVRRSVERLWEIALTAPSFGYISRQLNAEGLYRKWVRRVGDRETEFKEWSPKEVQRIVRHPQYKGLWSYGNRTEVVQRRPRPEAYEHGDFDTNWKLIPELAYVTAAHWDMVHLRLEDGRTPYPRKSGWGNQHVHPLSKLVECPYDSRLLTGEGQKWLACPRRREVPRCELPWLQESLLEQAVWEAIQEQLPHVLSEAHMLQALMADEQGKLDETAERVQLIEAEVSDYAEMWRVPALRAEAERRAEDAQARLDAAREELRRLRQQLAQESLAHEYIEALKAKDLPTWAMEQPATERQALYELLLERVRVVEARRFRMAEPVKVELEIEWREWLASRVMSHTSRRTARK